MWNEAGNIAESIICTSIILYFVLILNFAAALFRFVVQESIPLDNQRRIQNRVKYLRWSILQKYLMAKSISYSPWKMFDRIVNTPLIIVGIFLTQGFSHLLNEMKKVLVWHFGLIEIFWYWFVDLIIMNDLILVCLWFSFLHAKFP